MKRYSRLFIAALAAFGLASCSQELDQQIQTPQGNLVTVNFGAEAAIEGATKATLTPNGDDTFFKSAWVNGDELGVQYYNDGMAEAQVVHATWNETSYSFSTALPEFTGRWIYRAAYPAPETDGSIEFGSSRTQKGNAYNSKYDLMRGTVMTTKAPAGKTDDGKDIIFDMTRETAIAYFHFTSKLAEKVVSAKLSVTGGSIANSSVITDDNNSFVFSDDKPLNEITITFEESTAPDATDFKLWYNVRPTSYSSMTLEVETTGHKMTISRDSNGAYEPGRLYKVVKGIADDKWVAKGGETPDTKDFVLVTSAQSDWSGSYLLVGVNDVDYYAFDESINTDSEYKWGKCSKVVVDNNTIASTYGTMALEIVPGTAENTYSILTPSGKYLSASAAKKFNLSETYSADNCDFSISFGNNNEVVIKQASSLKLEETKHRQIRYNSNSNYGLRWYDGVSVNPVYLYKGPSSTKYSVSCSTVEGGKIAASLSRAEADVEVTLTATPAEGYAFNEWSVKGADETVIEVVDGKFTMPAQNVTVSGTFSKVAYTITKAVAENGSFIVKNGNAEVTTAFKGDKLTLEATPVEGFTFSNWNVTYKDGETEQTVNVNANAFYMPAANVTVSATFVEAAHVPVYASVAELIAAGKPTTTRTKVTVTLTDEEITGLHKVGQYTSGVFLMVGSQEVEVYCKDTPADWKVGGTISGTLTNCDWMLYVNKSTQKETWELCPADYSELTYKAPLPTCAPPEINIDEKGVASITCATEGATIRYIVGNAPADPTETSDVFSSATLTDGQTIKAIAFAEGYKPSAVASKKYTAGGAAESVIVTKTMSSIVTENNYTISAGSDIGTKQKTLKIDDVIELSSTGGGYTGSFWKSNDGIIDWRCYEAPNSVVKISAKEGYLIEKFTLTFDSGNSGTLDGGKIKSGTEYTVNTQSVSYKIGHSSGKKNGQIRIKAIAVTYKQQ